MANITTSPGLNVVDGRGYKTIGNEGAGGYRFSQITTTQVRKFWHYEFEYLSTSEKAALVNVAGQFHSNSSFSHYPFYFSDDNGTTIYFSRLIGLLNFTHIAYQAYSTNLSFEQEL